MSRIGKMPIEIPGKVQVNIDGQLVKAKGPLGEAEFVVADDYKINQDGNVITLERSSEAKKVKAMHGLMRSLLYNTIYGVFEGFTKKLIIEGVGFKGELKGKNLMLSLGFSHPILIIPPDGLEFQLLGPTQLVIKGVDKQVVGQIAAKIRKLRPPEPYKGKGIRYDGEYIRRKAGKTAA